MRYKNNNLCLKLLINRLFAFLFGFNKYIVTFNFYSSVKVAERISQTKKINNEKFSFNYNRFGFFILQQR